MDSNDRILITGGTGFIGGRLVEVLANRGLRMRVSTSDFRNCARVASLPVELVKADLRDHRALARAAADCSVVFHFAYRFGGTREEEQRANLDGTCSLAEAFLKNGGRRFVHISSVTAYGAPRDGEITEETPQRPTKDSYADTKQEIERSLRELYRTRGLAVTILQPTIVYGPYGYTFTVRLLDEVRSTCIALPAGGLCNAVYVDDVVSAATLAAERDDAVGETFLISGSSPTTWRQFYAAYETMLDRESVIELDSGEMQLEERRRQKRQSFIRRLHRALAKPAVGERLLSFPPHQWPLIAAQRALSDRAKAVIKRSYESLWGLPFDASEIVLPLGFWRALYSARTHVRIDKARKLLGYVPVFDLDEGMGRTAEWARSANLL